MVEQLSSAARQLWRQLKLLHTLAALLAVSTGVTGCVELPSLEGAAAGTADVTSLLYEAHYFAVKCQGNTCSAEARN